MTDRRLADWVRAHADEVSTWPGVTTDLGCTVERCQRDRFAAGLCKAHYKRASRAREAEERYP